MRSLFVVRCYSEYAINRSTVSVRLTHGKPVYVIVSGWDRFMFSVSCCVNFFSLLDSQQFFDRSLRFISFYKKSALARTAENSKLDSQSASGIFN